MTSQLQDRTKYEKDICFLFYVQNEYSEFMPDLNYSNEFTLSYWSLLKEIAGLDERFLKVGCILFILLMALDKIDGSGDVITSKTDSCMSALEGLIPYSSEEKELKELAIHILDKSKFGNKLDAGDEEKLSWAFKQFVKGYFCSGCN